jgi:hypothetical protein
MVCIMYLHMISTGRDATKGTDSTHVATLQNAVQACLPLCNGGATITSLKGTCLYLMQQYRKLQCMFVVHYTPAHRCKCWYDEVRRFS